VMRKVGVACAVALSLGSVAPAASQHAIRVSYRDLDLSRVDHQAQFHKRLSSAAVRVCVRDENGRFVGPSAAARQACHDEVMAQVAPEERRLASTATPGGTSAGVLTLVRPAAPQ
jgi:UrcA family protein